MLQDEIERVREGLEAGRFPNEASVSQGVVLRLLDALGWPSYDVDVVAPEYSLEGRRVDFALCHPPGKPLVSVFEELVKRDPSFPERFASLPKHGRTRRYLAQERDALYPGRPDLVANHSHRLSCGWWLGVNISRKQVERIVRMACGVADLRFGRDLVIRLGH